jgi:hypothetical protein
MACIPWLTRIWEKETIEHHAMPTGLFPFLTKADAICTGLHKLLLTGFLAKDYAQLVHVDPGDLGLTAVFRFTDANSEARKAYNFVQPTLCCNGKLGVVCMQRAGTLTVFRAAKFAHTSTINECGPDPESPSLGVAVVQKTRSLNVSRERSDVLENMISFPILNIYHSSLSQKTQ